MRASCGAVLGIVLAAGAAGAQAKKPAACSRVEIDGKVKAGESFAKTFTAGPAGMTFLLEALRTGWIVRVLPAGPRGPHDAAELATPPYRSVSPLLISTDFAFRAQDAVAWNPRRFQYAATAASFHKLAELYPKVMAKDAKAQSEVASLIGGEPEGELEITNAALAPGTADQWMMAAAVASHLEQTPHEVVGEKSTPLGRVASLEFRVKLDLAAGVKPAPGLKVEAESCAAR